jgi:DNA-binding transcriptional LysR family regulator
MSKGNLIDWEDLRYFFTVARHGTLAGAARKLGATPQAVAQRLENLERTLGYEVFTREAGALVLNSAGAAAFGEAAQMEMAACSLLQKHPPAVR